MREGGIRVPMIASWPGHIPAGTTSDHLSAFWDIMPTMCELAGVEPPITDGISMVPEMLGESERQLKHEFLYWEYPEAGGQKAVRLGNWKGFVRNIHKGGRKIELYDLSKDPREQNDVAEQYPEVVEKVLKIFRNEHITPEVKEFQLPVW